MHGVSKLTPQTASRPRSLLRGRSAVYLGDGLWFSPWELRGAIHERRELYRRLSPVHSMDRCTTPTLILHGESDDRCPIGQGEELYAALVAAGRMPVEFVRYPGGPHGFVSTGRPSHRVDYSQRVVDWMERYVR